YYYMSDQINSTRIITDDLGNVVYSEAYGPYGDVQKTWTKTYDPKQKFSGKEREGYSELDYFGARYFDNNSYRFISVDPIINKEGAIGNPQLWNLYAYCANNPITHFDPDGKEIRPGTPDDMPKPPGCNENNGWNFDKNKNYNPDIKDQRPGNWLDPEGNRWQWDPDPKNYHGGPHWDVDKPEPGKSGKYKDDDRRRYKQDGTEIKDSKRITLNNTVKNVIFGASVGYITYRIIRLLPSLIPPLWPTIPANVIVP
ncbi:MAG: hypothetical protein NT166_00030, partial [Candidatus Aminicenantes bacterium]|nr:hypothetical protein [Candidatus Aminicenantes bacterium]